MNARLAGRSTGNPSIEARCAKWGTPGAAGIPAATADRDDSVATPGAAAHASAAKQGEPSPRPNATTRPVRRTGRYLATADRRLREPALGRALRWFRAERLAGSVFLARAATARVGRRAAAFLRGGAARRVAPRVRACAVAGPRFARRVFDGADSAGPSASSPYLPPNQDRMYLAICWVEAPGPNSFPTPMRASV